MDTHPQGVLRVGPALHAHPLSDIEEGAALDDPSPEPSSSGFAT
jgi:hypothetical protein